MLLAASTTMSAQIPLVTAVTLALNHSPRIKLAEDDLRRAHAVVSETKDAFIPSVIANGGAGDSYGITLNVPTILTVNAQSLIYSSSQRFYLRASRTSLQAATLALEDVRQHIEEDVVLTYLNLDNITQVQLALDAEYTDTMALQIIMERRLNAGLETQLGLNQVRRQVLGVQLQRLQAEDERTLLQEHLSALTGLLASSLSTVSSSIPSTDPVQLADVQAGLLPATLTDRAAQANLQARMLHAQGDASYRWRPQVGFAAQYGRVSPINNVSDYYNLRGQYNVAFAGVQIQLPVFDAARKARAEEASIDAVHAQHDVEQMRAQEHEDRLRLLHALEESTIRAQIAELDFSIAEDQLKSTLLQAARGGDGGPVLNPKDEQYARVQVRQRYLDLLDARLQVRRTKVSLLRLTGGLDKWLNLPQHTVTQTVH